MRLVMSGAASTEISPRLRERIANMISALSSIFVSRDAKPDGVWLIYVKTLCGVMIVTTAFAACCGVFQSALAVERDWQKDPAIVEFDTSEDIFAVGDPHGDPDRLLAVLASAGLAHMALAARGEAKWSGGRSVLVVTGDLIDKGSDSIKVIEHLRTLQADATVDGGRVIVTMGNHEAEFLADPLGEKTMEFHDELQAAGIDPVATANCGDAIGKFLCRLPIAARINDWFFSHGGNTHGKTLEGLAATIEAGFAKHGFATEKLIGDDSILEARLNHKGPGGLPWFQDSRSSTDPEELLTRYAEKLGVNHLVQGHQCESVAFPDGKDRKESQFFQRYGLLFLIDTGMRHGIDERENRGGALHIAGAGRDQKAVVMCADGEQKTIWCRDTRDHEQKLCIE
jgi:hypothetical protein